MSNFRKFCVLALVVTPAFLVSQTGCGDGANKEVNVPTTFAPAATEDPPLTMAGPGGGGNTGGADKKTVLPMKKD